MTIQNKAMMKRLILLTILLISTSTIFSQDKSIQFGLSFNPKITNQFFGDSFYENGGSQDRFAYSLIGNLYFNLSDKFQLISGISYSQYQINLVDYSFIFLCDIDPTLGADVQNSYLEYNYHTNYIGIPIELQWKISNDKNSLFLQFGLEGLFKMKVKNDIVLYECGKKSGTPSLFWPMYYPVNNFLLLSKFGIGYEFNIKQNISLFFMPNVEYTLMNYFEAAMDDSKFLNIGLNMGIKF